MHRLYAVEVDTDQKEGEETTASSSTSVTTTTTTPTRPLTESDRLQLKAQMLKLQAEKLRLEAEKEQIQMEREALLKKQKKQQDIDKLVEKFQATKGEEAELKAVVKTYLRQIDADTLMRLRALAAEAETPEQALAFKKLGEGILAAILEVCMCQNCHPINSIMNG